MRKLFLLLSLPLLLASCANIKDTVVPPADLSLKQSLTGTVIYSEGCTGDGAKLSVSHYQGVFRMPQPSFIGGFPKKERVKMLDLAMQTAAYSFFREFEAIGATVKVYDYNTIPEMGSIVLKCNISKIWIGIYDNGWGGYGSAGDFWEAELNFDLTMLKDGKEFKLPLIKSEGQIKHAPISAGSFLDMLIISAKIATAAVNGSMFGVGKEGFVKYKIDENPKTPVEPAAGLAALAAAKYVSMLK
jgi:hypothetical protein